MSGDRVEEAAGAALRAVAAAPHPYPEGRFEGRGIVICAGGGRLLTNAWVTVCLLRRTLACTLPIELWHLGADELGPTEAALFADLDVATVDALAVATGAPARILGGWELKSYALAHCRFREVLLLDADNVPVRDPAFLFESGPYRETGAVFWPDIVRLGPDSGIWDLCGVPYRSEPAWESGQVVVDKARAWPALQVTVHMNQHSDVFYRHVHGDKDTFHLAWLMVGQPYAMTAHRARVVPFGILQHDFDGGLLFQHRTTAKWVLRGENVRSDTFRYEPECLASLADLRSRWSGRIEALPSRSAADLDAEAAVMATRWFRFERVGSDHRPVELLLGNRVGEGRTGEELRWWVEGGELVLAGGTGPTYRLQAGDDGRWRGRGLRERRQEVELTPLGDGRPAAGAAAAGGRVEPWAVVVAVVLDRVAAGDLDPSDAVTTLATLGRVGDLGEVLARERSRWPTGGEAAEVIERTLARLGRRDPSLHPHGRVAGQRYEPL